MKELPVVDPQQMERLKEWGGPGLQRKMIDLFLSHARERVEQINEGVSGGDAEGAETGAHTLKSSAGNVGASRVQSLAQEGEALAEAGKLEELKGLLPALEKAFEEACRTLEGIREGVEE
jgi:HPt (histidine-containing phosphotransfer) domain-containing protein